jgi:hypothetical protein
VPRRLSGRLLAAAALLVLPARSSSAQAYIPAPGDGTVSAAFQSVHSTPQLDSTGAIGIPHGETWDTQSLLWHVEYGLKDRIAVHASLPFMMTRYKGPLPHSDYDDGTYHGAFQDFYFGMRYGVVQSPGFALAPFVEVVIPSHHYESQVQSAPGRDVRVLVVGTAVGGFLDDVLPGLYFQSRLSYGFTQEVVNIRPNRTGIDSAVGYFINPRFAVQFIETFQYAHNGMWVEFYPELNPHITGGGEVTDEHWANHDRLFRARVLALGGGVTYALNESVDLFASASTAAWGRMLPRPERGLTVGMNWSFQTGRSSSRPKPNVKRVVKLP